MITPLDFDEPVSSRREIPTPAQDSETGLDITPIEAEVLAFLQGIDINHPELLYQAFRSQPFDFVTALLDKLEEALSDQYLPITFQLLRTLVNEFGWEMEPRYHMEDVDFPGQAYKLRRPSPERETQCRDRTMQTFDLSRPFHTKHMTATKDEAREFLWFNQSNDAEIILALQTRADDFAEAVFDLLEESYRSAWVDPRRPLVRYLLGVVGWEIGPTTGGTIPHSIMIRPTHHTLEVSPGGLWMAASWIFRANARRARERGELGPLGSYQAWYRAQFQATEDKTKAAEKQEAWVAKVREKQRRKRMQKSQAQAQAQALAQAEAQAQVEASIRDDTARAFDETLHKLAASKAKLEGRLEHVKEMQLKLWQDASEIRKQIANVDEHIGEVEKVKLKSRIPRPVTHSRSRSMIEHD